MSNLTSFDTAFVALTDHRAFRWQRRLYALLVAGQPPAAVDVPTGLGKTSVMALWLIALAQGATLPRRLIYVVDRRAVVDQATRFAADLCERLPSDLAEELSVADAGLPVSTLRGGKADNRAWLDDPSRPAIVVGTVDMVGSRLLFEGYGVSLGMRPYQAGFMGADTLIVLDEAHLCPPFEALLREIEEHRDGTFGPVGRHAAPDAVTPPVRLMSLSATGRSASASERTTFRLGLADREEEVVRQRLNAAKRLGLHSLDDPKKLPEEMAERAIGLGFSTEPKRIVVYCDLRRDALAAKKRIDREIKTRARKSSDAPAAKSQLLVGARRARERERVEDWLEDVGLLGSAEAPPPVPIFLVATSAGEVGIDMDADHMVCDLVAFERMVQRLGRVNRRGGADRQALVEVVCARPQVKPNAKGKAKAAQESALAEYEAREHVLRALEKDAEGRYDASPEALGALKFRFPDLVDSATTPPPLHPPLTRPHLEAWAMTSLIEHEGRTEVEPWLRGWEEDEEPQVEVVWRAHLPHLRVGDDVTVPPSMVAEFFQAAPIHATEKLETSRSHLLDWLFKRTKLLKRAADGGRSGWGVAAIVINRSGTLVASKSLAELAALGERREQDREKQQWKRQLASATLVLDSRFGGLHDGMLAEKQDRVTFVADTADDWLASAAQDAPPIKFRVVRASGEGESQDTNSDWLLNRTFEIEQTDAEDVVRLDVYKWAIEPTDEDSRSIQARPQALHEHAEQVAAKVRQIAECLRLPATEVDALEWAARFHDDGKAAVRWQEAMNAPRCGRPYAKTRGGGNWRRLEGYRHEFGSLLKAEKADLPADTRDLILHLIAAHHGHARPMIATAGCDEAPPTLLGSSAREAALRFARLQRRYGVWGLAWREAILRAADQNASREWAEAKRGNSG